MNEATLFAMALALITENSRKNRHEGLDTLQACIRTASDVIKEIAPANYDQIMYLLYNVCKSDTTSAERMQYEDMLKYCIYGAEYDD